MRWCFDNDDDGHWYMLPADRVEEFERWNDEDIHTLDFEQYRIGGHPSQFSFSEPSKPMRRIRQLISAAPTDSSNKVIKTLERARHWIETSQVAEQAKDEVLRDLNWAITYLHVGVIQGQSEPELPPTMWEQALANERQLLKQSIQEGLRDIATAEIVREAAGRIPHDKHRTQSPPPTKGLITWKCVPNCLRCRLDSFQQFNEGAPTYADTVQYRSQLEQARQECVGLRAEVNELRDKLGMGQKYPIEIG